MYDIIIVGSGPAGYVAAIRAGQLGKKTAIIEKDKTGGMCLNWGCIPTKALLESSKAFMKIADMNKMGIDGIDTSIVSFNWKNAVKRSARIVKRLTKGVEFLLNKNGVELISGEGKITAPGKVSVGNRLLETENIIIATGSKPAQSKFRIAEIRTVELNQLLELNKIPQKIVVEGSDVHAIEISQMISMTGRDSMLLSNEGQFLTTLDPRLSDFLKKTLKKSGVKFAEYSADEKLNTPELFIKKYNFKPDLFINASSREAVLPELFIEPEMSEGFLKVNSDFQTSVEKIYAAGDVNGISGFAHAASSQGLKIVNHICGIVQDIGKDLIPVNIYTHPEVAQIGFTEPQLKEFNMEYISEEFPLTANGKALIEGQPPGFIRILADKKYGEVLGVQIASANATDLISEASVLMNLESTIYDLAGIIHAHPTVSEIYMETGLASINSPIHK